MVKDTDLAAIPHNYSQHHARPKTSRVKTTLRTVRWPRKGLSTKAPRPILIDFEPDRPASVPVRGGLSLRHLGHVYQKGSRVVDVRVSGEADLGAGGDGLHIRRELGAAAYIAANIKRLH